MFVPVITGGDVGKSAVLVQFEEYLVLFVKTQHHVMIAEVGFIGTVADDFIQLLAVTENPSFIGILQPLFKRPFDISHDNVMNNLFFGRIMPQKILQMNKVFNSGNLLLVKKGGSSQNTGNLYPAPV